MVLIVGYNRNEWIRDSNFIRWSDPDHGNETAPVTNDLKICIGLILFLVG